MNNFKPARMWAFVWSGSPYGITGIIQWRRKECICRATELIGRPWKSIYRDGGRCVRVTVSKEQS